MPLSVSLSPSRQDWDKALLFPGTGDSERDLQHKADCLPLLTLDLSL